MFYTIHFCSAQINLIKLIITPIVETVFMAKYFGQILCSPVTENVPWLDLFNITGC